MKEELQSKLAEILTSMQAVAGKAGDFAMEQLPDIAQQYVVYGRVMTTLTLLVCIAVLLAVAWSFKETHRRVKSKEFDEMAWLPVGVTGAIVGSVSFIGLVEHLKYGALVWFAPKVWLLKEIAALVK